MTDWVVWSEEHGAWWGPGHWGYTQSLRNAGRYDRAEAVEIAARGNFACDPPAFKEVAMPDPLPAFDRAAGSSTERIELTLGECPPGLFRCNGVLGFKSEYKTESLSRPGVWQSDAYVVESGEYFWGGTSNPRKREALLVEPIDTTDNASVAPREQV